MPVQSWRIVANYKKADTPIAVCKPQRLLQSSQRFVTKPLCKMTLPDILSAGALGTKLS